MELKINGEIRNVEVEDNMPLLWVLRDELNMTGTKYGCGVSACGACTVQIDGVATRTCTLPASAAVGKEIKTIEGVAAGGQLSAIQKAYCQSGQIMAAEALLDSNPNPTDEDIDKSMTNICRCGTYQRIRSAIHTAAKWRAEETTLQG